MRLLMLLKNGIMMNTFMFKLDTVLTSWHLQSASYKLHLCEICTSKLMERNRSKMSFDRF